MTVRKEDFDEVVNRINRKYADDIRKGDGYENPPRISTGSLELDSAMGGGIPQGRFSRFYGGWHSCKTLVSLNVIAAAQAQGLKCAYYNIEKQYDPEFAAIRGVKPEELAVVEGTTIEEIGDKMEALLGVVHLHVIDSCTIAVSEDELNADVRDWRPGLGARAWGKVFRRLNERFDHHENTVLLLDQVRSNFKPGGGEVAAGGNVMDHQSSMTAHFKKGTWLFRDASGYLTEDKKHAEKGMSEQIEPEGQVIKVRVDKSRVGRPLLSATMWLDLKSLQFDSEYEFVKAGQHHNILVPTKPGSSWYEYNGDKVQGIPGLRKLIKEHDDVKDKIREAVFATTRD
jgi:recombination protein RecA